MESGKFKGSKVKISKRGSRYLRRVLYIAALANIKQYHGKYINPVLAEYYQAKIQSKPRKVALVAVMHKLVNYIFAVLRDKKPFRVITLRNIWKYMHRKQRVQNGSVATKNSIISFKLVYVR